MPAAAWAVPAAVGLLGIQQSNAQATSARHQAGKMLAPQVAAQQEMLQLGQNYNPAAEDAKAISLANSNASATLGKGLSDLNGSFLNAGGDPTGDTAFNVNATNMGNRVIDPLRAFTAQLASTQSQRKAEMLGRVFGAPAGQIANEYFGQANQAQDLGGNSMAAFLSALKQIPWGSMMGGATGSGWAPGNNVWGNTTISYAPGQDPNMQWPFGTGGGDQQGVS